MSDSWGFQSIKLRIQEIADLSRDGVHADAPVKYHKGLETELKALRAWIEVDEKQRAPLELEELRAIVAKLDNEVAELHGASHRHARKAPAVKQSAALTWKQ